MISFTHTVSAESIAAELMTDDKELGICLVELGDGCGNPQALAEDMDGTPDEIEKLKKLRKFLKQVITLLEEG